MLGCLIPLTDRNNNIDIFVKDFSEFISYFWKAMYDLAKYPLIPQIILRYFDTYCYALLYLKVNPFLLFIFQV